MRVIYKYLLMAFALWTMVGCAQNEMPGGDDEVINLGAPKYGYIFFDSMLKDTRGELINPEGPDDEPLKKDFAVIGYTYNADQWTTAEVQAKPNVFAQHPLKVTWNGSMHTYDDDGNAGDKDLVAWIGKQKYAFFAYYPYGSNYITTSGNGVEGNPYIDFELPSRNSVDSHIDVMTAHNIEADYVTRSVNFRMQHRLTAIDVIANNLYTEGQNVVVTDVTVKLENLLYDKVRIPLNMRDEEALVYPYSPVVTKTAQYKVLSSQGVNVTMNTNITGGDKDSGYKNKTMIVIPQNQLIDTDNDGVEEDCTISGTVDVSYTVDGVEKSSTPTFEIDRDLLSGHRYYILLNFSAGDVNIVVIESDKWAERDDIEYEFE